MTLFKRALCCMLVFVMVLTMAACATTNPEETTKPAETNATEPAQGTEEREHVELIVYTYVGNSNYSHPGWSETMEAVNEYLKEKLNTTLDMHIVGQSDYTSFAGPVVTGGTGVDMVFTRSSALPFLQYVGMNAFLPLEDYVDEYLPKTKELLPEASWDAVTVNGHLYAIPVERDAATRYTAIVNTTMTDDLGLTVPEGFDTLQDLYDFMYEAKAVRDKKYPEKANLPIANIQRQDWQAYYYSEPILVSNNWILAANVPGLPGVEGMGNGEKVYCPYLTDEYRELVKLQTQLVKDGLVPYDPESYDTDQVLKSAGEFLFETGIGHVYMDEDANMPYYKSKLITQNNAILATSGYQHGWAVTAQSKNIERCLEVVDLLNSDPYLATVLRFGPEGVGWTDEDGDNMIELTDLNSDPTNRYWYYWYGWNMGGLTVSKVPPNSTLEFGALLSELNNNAIPGANMGFVMDQTPVENEIVACMNVIAEFNKSLLFGQYEDTDVTVDEFVQKLKDNGIEKIIAEAQSQMDAWRAANS